MSYNFPIKRGWNICDRCGKFTTDGKTWNDIEIDHL